MTRVLITGYASLDHVVLLADDPVAGTTTRMRRATGAWPRPGGSPAYVAAALAAGGVAEAMPVSWVGDDAAGEAYRAALAARGLRCEGIATIGGAPTPVAILAYAPNGACFCLYDPGLPEPGGLTPLQLDLLASTDWVCLTVGPPSVTDLVLDRLPPATRLAWAVKHDPRAISSAQAARLAGRADLICYSRAEAGFVASALAEAGARRQGAVLVETDGAEGARIAWGGQSLAVPATPISVRDPTGAGDTLVGGLIAALIANPHDKPAALRAGMAAAAAMLRARQRSEEPT
jgi:ribokinase